MNSLNHLLIRLSVIIGLQIVFIAQVHAQADSTTFSLWISSDAHVSRDIKIHDRESIAEAIQQSEGRSKGEGFPAFDWDIKLHLGDIFGQHPTNEEGELIVSQFNTAELHKREQIYNLMGNHDASRSHEPENEMFRKWIDPMGKNPIFSGVDSLKRPYRVTGTYDKYSFEVGNILFLMLSDKNHEEIELGGRGRSKNGYPAGKVSLETFEWWKAKVIANQDKIIITCHHHMLRNTTVASDPFEGHGYHGDYDNGFFEGASYLYFIGEEANSNKFEEFLRDSGYHIDLWIGGHTHPRIIKDNMNGRSLVEKKYGVTFINVAALAKYHMSRSHLLTFCQGESLIRFQRYLHTEYDGAKGFHSNSERLINVSKEFQHPIFGDTSVPATKADESINKEISVYPNPSSDHLIINSSAKIVNQLRVEITEINGKRILEKRVPFIGANSPLEFNIQNIKRGVYIITIYSLQTILVRDILFKK